MISRSSELFSLEVSLAPTTNSRFCVEKIKVVHSERHTINFLVRLRGARIKILR